jgi:hypothetical protein
MRHPIAYALGGQISRALGFHTLQKPIRRAYEQSPTAVKVWLDTEYPGLPSGPEPGAARSLGGGEMARVNTNVRVRSYAPRGQTPVAHVVEGTQHKLSMISTVTNQGKSPLDDHRRDL